MLGAGGGAEEAIESKDMCASAKFRELSPYPDIQRGHL